MEGFIFCSPFIIFLLYVLYKAVARIGKLDGNTAYYIAYVLRNGKEVILWDDTRSGNMIKGKAFQAIWFNYLLTGETDYRVYLCMHEMGVGKYSRRYDMNNGWDLFCICDTCHARLSKYVDCKIDIADAENRAYQFPQQYKDKEEQRWIEGDPPVRERCDTKEDFRFPYQVRNLHPKLYEEMRKK